MVLDMLRLRALTYLDGALPEADTLAALLRPTKPRTLLVRMLHGVYAALENWTCAARCKDRLPAPDALRDCGLAYLALGHVAGPRDDLGLYLQRIWTRTMRRWSASALSSLQVLQKRPH